MNAHSFMHMSIFPNPKFFEVEVCREIMSLFAKSSIEFVNTFALHCLPALPAMLARSLLVMSRPEMNEAARRMKERKSCPEACSVAVEV